jgi:hypothetical protein
MSYLVTFPDGHEDLFTALGLEAHKKHWPTDKLVIRDLDQEARDREEMIQLLIETPGHEVTCKTTHGTRDCWRCDVDALLKRLGRLP